VSGTRLTPGARWLLIGLAGAAALVGAFVVLIDTHDVSMTAVAILTAAIVVGEAFKFDLPFRHAGSARYGLGDVSLTVGLLALYGTEVLIAATLAMVVSGFIDRPPLERRLFNITQYILAAGVAAGVMELVSPERGELAVGVFGSAALAVLAFTFINVLSVSGGIALSSGGSWLDGLRRIAPVAFLIALGNAALGLIAVAVFLSYPWTVPAVAVPLVLMYGASRQEVRAKIDRERSSVYVAVEQQLADTMDPDLVALTLAEGARQILGCNAAVWRADSWIGEVPEGSGECPVDRGLSVPLIVLGPGLGPATRGRCVAIAGFHRRTMPSVSITSRPYSRRSRSMVLGCHFRSGAGGRPSASSIVSRWPNSAAGLSSVAMRTTWFRYSGWPAGTPHGSVS
jgi:hypothetical protein